MDILIFILRLLILPCFQTLVLQVTSTELVKKLVFCRRLLILLPLNIFVSSSLWSLALIGPDETVRGWCVLIPCWRSLHSLAVKCRIQKHWSEFWIHVVFRALGHMTSLFCESYLIKLVMLLKCLEWFVSKPALSYGMVQRTNPLVSITLLFLKL